MYKYTSMQFIDKSSGKLCNYVPDLPIHTYTDIADIKAIFHVTPKYKTNIFSFRIFGREFLIKIYRLNK